MQKVNPKTEAHLQHHRDGSLWVKGQTLDGLPSGYWGWFRKNGVRLRSGFFEHGEQTGKWITYDQAGAVYKMTTMKPKAKSKSLTQAPEPVEKLAGGPRARKK